MIDICIVNWNSGEALKKCIHSLLNQSFKKIKVFIYDNNSTDNSISEIRKSKNLFLFKGKKNIGFSAACNLLAQRGRSPILIFINPDLLLHSKSLYPIFKKFKQDKKEKIAVIGVKLLNENKKIWQQCTYKLSLLRYLLFCLKIQKIPILNSFGLLMMNWNHKKSKFVNHVTGAFYAIRRKSFEEMGGFDNQFFVYLEDLDLSYRLRQCQKKIYYFSKITCFHAGGGCSKGDLGNRMIYQLKSQLYFAEKHFSSSGKFLIFVSIFYLDLCFRIILYSITINKKMLKPALFAINKIYGQK